MKFTKEQAFESLKRELTNNDKKTLRMSIKSLDKLTDTLISEFADEEIGLPDFCTKALTILNVVNDNVGKDKSDFVKNWEKDHPSDPTDPNPEPPKPKENPEMKALMDRIAALEADKQASEKKATIAQKRKEMSDKLKEKGVKDDKWVEKLLSKVNLDREFEIDAEVEEILPLYNAAKANGGNTVLPGNPTGSPQGQQNLDDVSALAKQRRQAQEASVNN